MDKAKAYTKWRALCNMTEARGCTKHEAETAKKFADVLAKKFGFADTPTAERWRPDFDARYARAEAKAAMRYGWEYRRCWKARCRCMRGGAPHGPYKYGKVRRGNKVNSVYLGR